MSESIDIRELLLFTKERGASDLHISSGALPMLRLHGEMRRISPSKSTQIQPSPLIKDITEKMLMSLLSEEQKQKLLEQKEIDFSITLEDGCRFRGNIFYQERGIAGVFRVIPNKIPSLSDLGLPPVIERLANCEKGLVLVTGPTGSGKSTTLAAMIELINSSHKKHILTIEDPIEFVYYPKQSLINQREVGENTLSFSNALKSALRENPDVILVGEMRDLETIALAITAAETGHLVFGTLHTNSAHQTVDRVINVFPAGEQAQIRTMLSESLQGVISQVLVPKKGGGRIALFEILVVTSAAKALIRDGKVFQIPNVIQTGAKQGMQTRDQAIVSLLEKGTITKETADKYITEKMAS